MRIGIVTETWLPSTDGVVTRLVATIRELRAGGHEVLVVVPGAGSGDVAETFLGARVRTVPTMGMRWLYGGKRWGLPMPRIVRWLRDFGPDVVHVVNPVLMGAAGVVAARRQDCPLVASYHTNVVRYASYYRLGWLAPVIWAVLRALHGRAEVNLATSAATCAELRAQRIDRVSLWRRGVDLELFQPNPPAADQPPHRPIALYVGRIAAEKGLDRLSALAQPGSPARLMLVGDGPQRAELADRFGPAATFTGLLHGPELAAAYRMADVFVFPSTTDTLGLVLLEALASGLPVVAADSPASRELLAECPVASLFPADDPSRLADLVRAALRPRSGPSAAVLARREAEQWSWAAATAQLVEYYRAAIATHTLRTGGATQSSDTNRSASGQVTDTSDD
ncbi:MAG TPA: glycosyltransferase family 1 protein [Pseudonocardiaceae bacterium]|nr:glycosyltransferase family 1 protein [Pseudonocardiaceae bacterium]